MSTTEEGRRDLAAICGSYLAEHRPETTVREAEADSSEPGAAGEPGTRGKPGAGSHGSDDRPPAGRRRRSRPRRR